MSKKSLRPDRRAVLGGVGASFLLQVLPAVAQARAALALEAAAGTLSLKAGQPPIAVWRLTGGPDAGPLRFKRGETIDVTLTNRLPVPIALTWVGLDGNAAAEPLTGRPALAAGASATFPITLRHAGTMTVGLVAVGSGQAPPSISRAVLVSEPEPLLVDRDEVLLFQDWRLRPDGSVIAPGNDPSDAATVFTVKDAASADVTLSLNERIRLRFINASQAQVIAITIANYNIRVMAIDGQPSEPFLARDGLVVLAPGSRIDIFVEANKPANMPSAIMLLDGREAHPIGKFIVSDAKPVRPAPLPPAAALPSNGLPAQLDLKSALRVDLPLGTADWLAPAALTPTTPPAFKVKRGRIVVLALTNRGAKPVAFQLHGHHFRLLDRLDDGWKPFWLDTLAIEVGATQRIAFAAEFPGLYPMQAVAADWAAPRLMRSYLVE